jgi:hypothetical protein
MEHVYVNSEMKGQFKSSSSYSVFILKCVCVSMYACIYVLCLIHHQLGRPVLTSPEAVVPSFLGTCRAFMCSVMAMGPVNVLQFECGNSSKQTRVALPVQIYLLTR